MKALQIKENSLDQLPNFSNGWSNKSYYCVVNINKRVIKQKNNAHFKIISWENQFSGMWMGVPGRLNKFVIFLSHKKRNLLLGVFLISKKQKEWEYICLPTVIMRPYFRADCGAQIIPFQNLF